MCFTCVLFNNVKVAFCWIGIVKFLCLLNDYGLCSLVYMTLCFIEQKHGITKWVACLESELGPPYICFSELLSLCIINLPLSNLVA